MAERYWALVTAMVLLASGLVSSAKAQVFAGACLIWVAFGLVLWVWADLRLTERRT